MGNYILWIFIVVCLFILFAILAILKILNEFRNEMKDIEIGDFFAKPEIIKEGKLLFIDFSQNDLESSYPENPGKIISMSEYKAKKFISL